ncbi:thioredoxin [Youxingia wuxianensis]|uniref:Thioredoxin n=1 Tax=Youxingia wuxianensis TaxID=2763678 RepID=A0A926ERJ3_9FIRM|nr:thioredoxin [Youxingia wuxianensis]MBC8586127.1 thioredoxin [Youxingia wuxianensis]
MSTVHFTKDTFVSQVLNSKGLVLVDFWAPWCGPCKMVGPIVDSIAQEFEGKAVVGKVNVDDEQELAVKFGVMSIPTILVFKNGQEVNRVVGLQSKQALAHMLEQA